MIRQLPAAFAVVVVLAVPMHAQERKQLPPGMSEVDGQKDPSAIPDYQAWRQAFRMLGPDRTRLGGTPNDEMMLPYVAKAERDVIVHAALRSAAAEAASRARMEHALANFKAAGLDFNKKEDAKKVGDALFEIDYAQRVTTLQERDALLEKLTPETRGHIESMIDTIRRGIYTIMQTSELERYRLPS